MKINASAEVWKSFLSFSANMYAYSYEEQLQIFSANEKATAVAPFNVWSKMGVRIKSGAKAIRTTDSSGKVKKLFDVSQTTGKIDLWKYHEAYNPYLYDMLDRISSDDNVIQKDADFTTNVYNFVFDSVFSKNLSATGKMSPEICEIIAQSAAYTICKRLDMFDDTYDFELSGIVSLDDNALKIVGNAVSVYSNAILRSAKQVVKTISLTEALSRQSVEQQNNTVEILPFENDISAAEIETINNYAETEDDDEAPVIDENAEMDEYIVEPDTRADAIEDSELLVENADNTDINESAVIISSLSDNSFAENDREEFLREIFRSDYATVKKNSVAQFYKLNHNAKTLIKYTYASYKGSHNVDLSGYPDVKRWFATAKGISFTRGSVDYHIDWLSACKVLRALIDSNSYALPEKSEPDLSVAETVREYTEKESEPELTPMEQSFLKFDITPVMAKSPLAWDEIEDIGYILFEKGYTDKYQANEKAIYGNGLHEPELYDIAHRMRNGEDIRRELSIALLGRQDSFTTKGGNEFTVTYNENDITAKFGNAEKSVSYEAVGDAFLSLIKGEYDSMVHDRTIEELRNTIPNLPNETAEKLITAFDGAALPGWEKGDNQPKLNRIKKALFDILGNEEQTEKAFASIADMKYNVKFETEKPDSLDFHFGSKEHDDEWISESEIVDAFAKEHPDCSFALANAVMEYLDEKQHSERNIKELHAGWYKKTDFTIHAVVGGEEFNYDGRFDIGDGKGSGGGSLIDHIRDFNQGIIDSESYPYNTPESKEKARKTLDIFVPFLEKHSHLNDKEQDILHDFIKYNPIRDENHLKAQRFAKEQGIPFQKSYSDGIDDEPNIYAYSGDMSIEDFRKMQLLNEESAENQSLMSDVSEVEGEQLSLFGEKQEYANGLFVGGVNRFTALHDEIMQDTAFLADKRKRVQEFHQENNPTNREFADFLKKEYGTGGHSGDDDKIAVVDYDSSGIIFTVRDRNGSFSNPNEVGIEKFMFTWSDVAEFTSEIIERGEYFTEKEQTAKPKNVVEVEKTEPVGEVLEAKNIDSVLKAFAKEWCVNFEAVSYVANRYEYGDTEIQGLSNLKKSADFESYFANHSGVSKFKYHQAMKKALHDLLIDEIMPLRAENSQKTNEKADSVPEKEAVPAENAEIGADVLGLNMLSKHGKPMVGFPDHVKDEYSKKLDEAGYGVIVLKDFSVDESYNLTQNDFDIFKKFKARKSVLNFTDEELKLTHNWAERFESDIKEKSPFYRAENGEWRDKDQTKIDIIDIENKNTDYQTIKADVKKLTIKRGVFLNNDTGWQIQVSRAGVEDSIRYAFEHNDNIPYEMLYNLKPLVEKGILLDSQITERNKNSKALNSAFMHKLYGICKVDNQAYLARMSIEEFSDAKSSTLKRLYNLQDIKIEPLRIMGLADDQLRPAVLNSSSISISDLFTIVKASDKDFYTNVSDYQITQEQKHQQSESVQLSFFNDNVANRTTRNNVIYSSKNKQRRIYEKFAEQFPEFVSGEYSYLRLESEGYMPLSLEHLGGNRFSMAHYYEQNGDLMADPDIELVIDAAEQTITAVAYQQDNLGIYRRYEDNSDDQDDCNAFVEKWLDNIKVQGFEPVRAISSGQEISFEKQLAEETDTSDSFIIEAAGKKYVFSVDETGNAVNMTYTSGNDRYEARIDKINRIAIRFSGDIPENIKSKLIEKAKELDIVYDRDKFVSDRAAYLLNGSLSDSEDGFILIKHLEMTDNDPDNYKLVIDELSDNNADVQTETYNKVTELPFNTGDELDYRDRHYTVSGIDPEKGTVTLRDDNTGWYPLFHDESLDMVIAEYNTRHGKDVVEAEALASVPQNFVITDNDLGVGGPKQKYSRNIAAIRLLKSIENDNRYATPEEQQVLSEYVGWGGLPEAFDENNGSWSSEYKQLKELLTAEEYEAALGSVLNAHYTQPVIINAMYTALRRFGFKGGKMLEPAAGIGNFIGSAPKDIADSSDYTAIELDSISGRIAKKLYPQSEVQICGFQSAKLKENTFDAAIGNVPFGDYSVADKKYNKSNALIHDYFFLKSIDMVRPNGIVAFITSKGTMDKKDSKIRRMISEKAEFIGAIRLPDTAFKSNAGTTVVSDIIFLQKRVMPATVNSGWINASYDNSGHFMNEYFIEHPEMICGTVKFKSGPFGLTTTVEPFEDKNLEQALSECVDSLIANTDIAYTQSFGNIEEALSEPEEETETIPMTEGVFENTHIVVDNKIYFRKSNENFLRRVKLLTANGKPQPKSVCDMAADIVSLAAVLKRTINLQGSDISDEEYEVYRNGLVAEYEKFVSAHGTITENNDLKGGTYKKAIGLINDTNVQMLMSLEKETDGQIQKADILKKRTVYPTIKITHCDTIEDGFHVTLAEKGYIDIEKIVELTGNTADECVKRLNGVLMFRNHNLYLHDDKSEDAWITADEYLSGNVVYKLGTVRRLVGKYPELKVNLSALEKVQPERIQAVEILIQLGSSWIPGKYIEQFVLETFGLSTTVEHNLSTANWHLSNKNHGNWRTTTTNDYGTPDVNAMYILENTLNLKDTTVWRQKRDESGNLVYDENGNAVREKDVEKTIAANHKAEKIKEAFKEWVWKDPYRTQDLENIYNALYNTDQIRQYDGSHLTFEGMTADIELKDHQRNAVARILYGGNTLLSHVVGAGKTFEMAAAAMEMKRIGTAKKPLFVVPNHLIKQWGKEFYKLYPNANILLATSEDFAKSKRRTFVSRIATGDYDAVIMGYSTFSKITVSPEKRKEYYEEEIDELMGIISSSDKGSLPVKEAQKKKLQLENRLKSLEYNVEQDDNIYFENLGVDALFLDEAHNFKNLSINTKLTRIAGIKSGESKRSEDLLLKIRYIKEKHNGLDRGIVFATGTPISNSLTEMYVMKKYLEPDYLKERGLEHFDSWVADFAEITTSIELSPTGTSWRSKKRCSSFKNIPELMKMYRRIADIQTAEMLDLPVPKLKGGKYTLCITKPSQEQKNYIFDCGLRAESVHNREVSPSEDNMLKITNDGKMCALDMRLIDPNAYDDPDSKINTAIRNIYDKWAETAENRLTQVVFLDRSTPSDNFNLYDDIKDKLVAMGVPAEEIKFIHDAKNDNQKLSLFDDVNAGKVRIIIGSTEKLGAGTNIQNRLCALHHIDVPWRPSDIEQREGRILRQGNSCKEVEIFRYATEGTFDSYSWQTIEHKQKFISQVNTDKPLGRSVNDIDEAALNYAEIKSLATGDPRIKKQLELSMEVEDLKREKAEFEAEQIRARKDLTFTLPEKINRAESFISKFSQDAEYAKQYPKAENFSVTINGAVITDREEAGKMVKELRKLKVGDESIPIDVCKYRGFDIQLRKSSADSYYTSYKLTVSHRSTLFSGLGVANTDVFDNIDKAIDEQLPDKLKEHQEILERAKLDTAASQDIAGRVFSKLVEYQTKSRELEELTADLGISNNSDSADIVFDTEDTAVALNKEKITDTNGRSVAQYSYAVPEKYLIRLFESDEKLYEKYNGNFADYIKEADGKSIYEKAKRSKKVISDDNIIVDERVLNMLNDCCFLEVREADNKISIVGTKPDNSQYTINEFDYDYKNRQIANEIARACSDKLDIALADSDSLSGKSSAYRNM